MVHAAQRGQVFHDGARAAKGCERHASANHLAQHGDVGPEAGDALGVHALRAAERYAEAGHHFIKHQQRAVFGAQLAAALHEGHTGAHKVHVACNGFDHHAGQLLAVQGKGFFQLRNVVVLEHQGVLHHFRRHARAGSVAKGGQARAGFNQQRIGMAVVAALELDELAAAGGATGQANGAHARFGARADEADHLHRWHQAQDFFGQLHFALCGGAEAEAFECGLLHRFKHGGVAVAQDHRAPGADVVDETLVVGIPEVGALRALDEAGCAAHGLEGTHGRVHAAGDQRLGAFKQGNIEISAWCHGVALQSLRWPVFRQGNLLRCLRTGRPRAGPRTCDRE